MNEAKLQALVVELATELGLVCLHVREPRREDSVWTGFPDLLIIRPGGGLLPRELKMPGKQLRAGQKQWAVILAGQDFAVWKPHDWHTGRIRAELETLAGHGTRAQVAEMPQDRLWRALAQAAETDG
jgi:hypothetical protein